MVLSGKWVRGGARPKPQPGLILEVRPYELHGTRYYAVLFRLDGEPPDSAREARLSFDMIYDDPQSGDRVLVESVIGVVDRIRRDEATAE
ncbi:MAG: hypothetical protein WEC75_03000 [Dehalococcoidia bacterium]